jgi:hypothetical protein
MNRRKHLLHVLGPALVLRRYADGEEHSTTVAGLTEECAKMRIGEINAFLQRWFPGETWSYFGLCASLLRRMRGATGERKRRKRPPGGRASFRTAGAAAVAGLMEGAQSGKRVGRARPNATGAGRDSSPTPTRHSSRRLTMSERGGCTVAILAPRHRARGKYGTLPQTTERNLELYVMNTLVTLFCPCRPFRWGADS